MRVFVQIGCVLALGGLWSHLGASDRSFSGKRVEVPLTVLRTRADLIILATISQVDPVTSGGQTVQLQVARVLQGQTISSSLVVRLTPPVDVPNLALPATAIGKAGIWFLGLGSNGYGALPLFDGVYTQDEYFLPNSDPNDAPPPTGTIDQQLLTYLLRWYLAVPKPGPYEDGLLFASLDKASRQDAAAAVRPLLTSVSSPHRTTGIAAAIRVGSPDAFSALDAELPTLSSNPKSWQVVRAIQLFYPFKDTGSIAPLQSLINAGVAGLDAAVGAALRQIGTKAVAPAMAKLLDSHDPQAQLLAATYFGTYSLFANANGDFPDSGPNGPFATADTWQFRPRRDSGLSPAQYAQFWKTWWSANYLKLGFTAP